MKTTKRFIAGAVCPRCGELDKLMMYRADGKQYRECVSCDFHDEMRFNTVGKELETRVNRSAEERQQEVSVVKLVEPK